MESANAPATDLRQRKGIEEPLQGEQDREPEEGTMRALCFKSHAICRSAAKVLRVESVKRPGPPGAGFVLVKVACCSLNPADTKSAEGEQAALLGFGWPRVVGFDFSGTVAAAGPGVQLPVGAEVFGMIDCLPEKDHGTAAEFMLVPAKVCAVKPPAVPHEQAAAVPLVGITALKMIAAVNLKTGERPRVLVTRGAGGVGTVTIQLLVALYDAEVVTTASPARTPLMEQLGASKVLNYKTFLQELDGQFDGIFDCTGEALALTKFLKPGGGVVSILAGPTQLALQTFLEEGRIKSVTCGVKPFLLSRCGGWLFELFSGARRIKGRCEAVGGTFAHVIGLGNGPMMAQLAGLMAAGRLRAVVDCVFPLDESLSAVERLQSGHACGKVVIRVAA